MIKIGEQTSVRLPLAMLLALAGVIASAAIVWGGDHAAVSENGRTIEAHDSRITVLERSQANMQADTALIRNDVQWIRRTLEGRSK